jgi:hypothetical protein
MIKTISFAFALLFGAMLTAGTGFAQDKSTHHAAMHAEHWVNHHASAPHRHHRKRRKVRHHDKSVHHAAMHAEHWVNHHVSAPHKNP